jgi:hypothetical protein
VSIVAPTAEVEVELTLPAGAYTVQAKASHWLRGEGTIVTPPSWKFAVATGVNKITVYWSPVPGATGYRIFRSTKSGVYDFNQPAATVESNTFHWTNTGLSTGLEYFYVVQAIANGSNNTVSAASDEDSDVPDAQSIPWDESPTSILQAVRGYVINRPGGLRVMAPDGSIYTEGYQIAFPPDGYVDIDNSQLVLSGMSMPMPSCLTFEQQEQIRGQSRQPQKIDAGAFRRMVSRSQYNNEQYEGVSGFVYLPKVEPANLSLRRSEEKPFIYLGVTSDNLEVDAGIMFHQAGYGSPSLPHRWQAFAVVNDRGRKWRGKPLSNDLILLVMGENPSTGNYIWADSELGNYVFIGVYAWQQPRIGWLLVDAFDAYGLYYSQTFCFALRIPNIRIRPQHDLLARLHFVDERGRHYYRDVRGAGNVWSTGWAFYHFHLLRWAKHGKGVYLGLDDSFWQKDMPEADTGKHYLVEVPIQGQMRYLVVSALPVDAVETT